MRNVRLNKLQAGIKIAGRNVNNLRHVDDTTLLAESEVAQSRLTLCHPVDCSPPGSSVHGILQARILEWVATSFSRGIFLIQGSNLRLLPWQVNSLPLSYQGSPPE